MYLQERVEGCVVFKNHRGNARHFLSYRALYGRPPQIPHPTPRVAEVETRFLDNDKVPSQRQMLRRLLSFSRPPPDITCPPSTLLPPEAPDSGSPIMSEVPKSPPETPFKTEGQHADSEPPHDYSFTPAGPPPLSTQSLAFSDPSMAKTPKPTVASSDREDQDPRAPLPAFDWEDFERRYEQKLAEANERENQIIQEFDQLANV